MNQVKEDLIIELNRAMFEEPWYGASIKTILESIEPEIAYIKPPWSNHSITEIALHIWAWNEEIISRLNGNEPKEPEMGDWPQLKSIHEEYWQEIKENIFNAHKRIISIIEQLPVEIFETKIGNEHLPGLATGFNYRESLLGLMQHNIYHGGQISLLRIILKKYLQTI
jgi:uncharacterized damage-inducible protein DinB